MSATAHSSAPAASAGWLTEQACHLDDLFAVVGQATDHSD
jgi:hypothetical protein